MGGAGILLALQRALDQGIALKEIGRAVTNVAIRMSLAQEKRQSAARGETLGRHGSRVADASSEQWRRCARLGAHGGNASHPRRPSVRDPASRRPWMTDQPYHVAAQDPALVFGVQIQSIDLCDLHRRMQPRPIRCRRESCGRRHVLPPVQECRTGAHLRCP